MVNLTTLLLANNRICKIEKTLAEYIPNLSVLIMTNNMIQSLGDLDPLLHFEHLETLSLVDNPVTELEYYRLYVIHRCPKLRILDFRKVKDEVKVYFFDLRIGTKGCSSSV
jgi:U2 small nuclear ribonucleoprotein A'